MTTILTDQDINAVVEGLKSDEYDLSVTAYKVTSTTGKATFVLQTEGWGSVDFERDEHGHYQLTRYKEEGDLTLQKAYWDTMIKVVIRKFAKKEWQSPVPVMDLVDLYSPRH